MVPIIVTASVAIRDRIALEKKSEVPAVAII
jgi:hypothetical protein